MTSVDRILQNWRVQQVSPWIPERARVLDIGCADGRLFEALGNRLDYGLGLDPDLTARTDAGRFVLMPGSFPEDVPAAEPFDVITMLAVLEHIPGNLQAVWAQACARLLRPKGLVLITVPSPWVDPILDVLRRLRLVHGMCLEQHYGFAAGQTPSIFLPHGFDLAEHHRFELGLNHFFAFRKAGS